MKNKIIDPRIVGSVDWGSLPDVLTAAQIAPLLHISISGVYVLMKRSEFPTLRVKGKKYVDKHMLKEWLNSYDSH